VTERASKVLLGRTEVGADFFLDFSAAWHTAIQGQSRSGKSVLTYVALSQLAAMRNVIIAGCDPTGILLNPFAWAPRSDLRALGAGDLNAHIDVLAALLSLMQARIDALLAKDLDKIETFTEETPLVVVVMEEYPGLLSAASSHDKATGARAADAVAPRIASAVGRLARESAKVGFRLVLLAQRFSSQAVDTDTRSQFGARISLRLDNADAVRMLHDSVSQELLQQFPDFLPGVAYAELPGSKSLFRTDVIDYSEYVRRVRHFHPQGA